MPTSGRAWMAATSLRSHSRVGHGIVVEHRQEGRARSLEALVHGGSETGVPRVLQDANRQIRVGAARPVPHRRCPRRPLQNRAASGSRAIPGTPEASHPRPAWGSQPSPGSQANINSTPIGQGHARRPRVRARGKRPARQAARAPTRPRGSRRSAGIFAAPDAAGSGPGYDDEREHHAVRTDLETQPSTSAAASRWRAACWARCWYMAKPPASSSRRKPTPAATTWLRTPPAASPRAHASSSGRPGTPTCTSSTACTSASTWWPSRTARRGACCCARSNRWPGWNGCGNAVRAPGGLEDLASGPGRLTLAMGITRAHNGVDVTRGLLVVREPAVARPVEIAVTRRVGIRHCADSPLRFLIAGSPFVSRRAAPETQARPQDL